MNPLFKKLTLGLVCIVAILTAHAQPHNSKIHVAINGNDSGSIGLIGSPFRKIQSAINYSLTGDTIIVHPGRYKENPYVDGKDIFIFSEYQSVKDSNLLKNTIVDGDSSANAFILKNFNGELDGFTIERGLASYGAGLWVYNSNNPKIRNCIIQKNIGTGDICGHGLVMNANNGLVENCIIRNNWGRKHTVEIGGYSTFRNSVVYNNNAWEESNVVIGSASKLYNVLIHHNNGGGLKIWGPAGSDTASIHNLIIAYNSGFGIHNWSSSTNGLKTRISNSIIYGNAPKNIILTNSYPPAMNKIEIDYCILEGGASAINTNTYNIVSYGSNNLDVMPRFISEWDFHLQNTSAAIGKGKNSVAFQNFSHTIYPFDFDGNPRPNPAGTNPDIGAYENALGIPIDTSCNYTFTTLPANASLAKGSNHTFNSFHTGNYAYQWQSDAAGLGWQNIPNLNQYSGANSNNLILNAISVSNHKQRFRVIASKTGCADTAVAVILNVIDVAKDSADLVIAKDSIAKLNQLLVNKHDTLYVGSNITTDTLKISIRTGLSSASAVLNSIKVYPNPAATVLHIDLEKPGNYIAKLSGITGQTVVSPTSGTIDISSLANGVYVLTIYDSNNNLISTNKISIIK